MRNPLLIGLFLLMMGSLSAQSQLPYNWKPVAPAYDGFFRADTIRNPKRVKAVTGICLGGYGLAYTGIALAWYKDFPRTKWHWFNDNNEWGQVDKIGHTLGGYQGARGMIGLFKWSGMSRKQTALYGGIIGFMSLAPIELLDGYAEKWGGSWGDLVADGAGAGLAFANEMLWSEQRIQIKISYHPTAYAKVYPNLFGNDVTKVLKDYNGHTGWLSFRVHSWLPEGKFKRKYPRWLNIAVGYGANGLTGGYDLGLTPSVRAREYRQYYLTVDVDFTAIPTRYGGVRLLLDVLNVIHFPAPALELNGRQGLKWHWLYM